jgi:hypothetical protein
MSTELERAKGSPCLFTLTSNDELSIVGTADLDTPIDIVDITLPPKPAKQMKYLMTISYYLEIEIPSPAESNLFETVFVQCTLDATNTNFVDGVDCHPTGRPVSGMTRGVSFGNNFGLTTQRYRGAHSFTWVEKVNAGPHKIFMRASWDSILSGPPPSSPPTTIFNPKILKRTLVVQAVPI